MSKPKIPGVYVEEISSLPFSVAELPSSVPAFVGYTEKVPLLNGRAAPRQIKTLTDFITEFGGAASSAYEVEVALSEKSVQVGSIRKVAETPYLLYYALQLYFLNGGGTCYIASAGTYKSDGTVAKEDFIKALGQIAKMEDPTLLLIPEAVKLPATDQASVYNDMLTQCHRLNDRFAILDIAKEDTEGSNFRAYTLDDPAYLQYGAAYLPFLHTSIPIEASDSKVSVILTKGAAVSGQKEEKPSVEKARLDELKDTHPAVYQLVWQALKKEKVTLPPSGAMAGIYYMQDQQRGVWKAPANVNVAGATGLTQNITAAEQENLNVDLASGKSINALRSFPGKGILVWGARTLAGNDQDWRYVPVRRLMMMVEASLRSSTRLVAFEPNNHTTWQNVKSMISNYLNGLWQQGALMGASPQNAYFVKVGLGETMTAVDLQEGRMIVEIGMAVARPAEFIILRFSQEVMGG